MATTKGKKTLTPGVKKSTKKAAAPAKPKVGKASTKEQLDKLEKALEQIEGQNVMDLVPEEIKADIEQNETENVLEDVKPINLDEEVKKVFETAEPSEEVANQIKEFDDLKEKFNKNIEKEPQEAENLAKGALKKAEALKKRAEALRAANEKAMRRETFTNVWNGTSYDF